jgi:Holliday junction DNA helicase RuvA
MISYIKGSLGGRFDGGVIIEANGLGYMIFVPGNSSVYLAEEGQPVKVFTKMIMREDDVSLYGFSHRDDLKLFEQLITVNGVGAKAALSILSVLPSEEVKKAIIFQDAALLTRANGVGKKTADRIVLELKDKLGALEDLSKTVIKGVEGSSEGDGLTDQRTEAFNALCSLGYSKAESIQALSNITDEGLSSQEYIKKALNRLF